MHGEPDVGHAGKGLEEGHDGGQERLLEALNVELDEIDAINLLGGGPVAQGHAVHGDVLALLDVEA